MKNITKTTIAAVAFALLSTGAMADGWAQNYNKTLNTPKAKAELNKRVCSSGHQSDFVLCENWAKTGVPDSDVRYGIVALGVVVGAGAGMLAATVPVAALSGKTVLAHVGVTSIAGNAVTALSAGVAGAVVGGVVGVGVASAVGPTTPTLFRADGGE
jgi:hypothetical protein